MRSPRWLVAAAALLLVLTGCSPSAVPSSAIPARSGSVAPDFDGDGTADLVYGIGSTHGRVAVSYGTGKTVSFERTDVGGPASESDDNVRGFGDGVLAADLNADGLSDLVVVDSTVDAGGSAVYLIFGADDGLNLAQAHRYPVAGVGGTPALLSEPDLLLVVAGGGDGDGGALTTFRIGSDGLPLGAAAILTQRALTGEANPGDRFGAALAASADTLVVGVPGKGVDTATLAGAVFVATYQGQGVLSGRLETIDPARRGEGPRSGDRLGASVAVADGRVAAGMPGRTVGRLDAGAVLVFPAGDFGSARMIDESANELSGKPASGEQFGSSVALIRVCDGAPGVLVGAFAEAVDGVDGAGAAWVIPLTASADCPAKRIAEGGVLSGRPTQMGLVGAAVGRLRTGSEQADTLIVAAPSRTEDSVAARVFRVPPPYADSAVVADGLLLNEEGTIALSPVAG